MLHSTWYLTSESDAKVIYVVPHKKELTIGRSPDPTICDFAIQEDPSISRKHATLLSLESELFVKDLGSRYGTFVNNSKIENTNVKLNNKDVVKFGKMNSVWHVHVVNFITCTSTLKGENLTNLKLVLSKIGGVLRNEWDDTCQYLTMPAITLTIKVVLALVQGSLIVTTEYWNKCLAAITNNEALPNPKSYTPEVVESTLNKDAVSFLPTSQRRSLFTGKKFIFLSKRQFDMYKAVLVKGGGQAMLFSETKLTKLMICEKDMAVIQYNITTTSQETEAQKNEITEIFSYLKSKGKRVIADAEIGLAILYVSTDKYCNPDFNFSSEVMRQAPTQQISKVLAPETQEQSAPPTRRDNVIINESLTSNDGNSSKRKLCDDNEETNKKLATNVNKTQETAKRKHDNEDTNNPTKKMAMNNEDDDLFNFITPGSKDISNKTKSADKLNLAKPLKRKADFDADEDNLFNFVQNNEQNDAPSGMFDVGEGGTAKKNKTEQVVEDISAMRGSKLGELNKINQNWNSNVLKPHIKKEVDEELDEKMNLLDIGSVVVTIKENLIIKKEPLEVEAQDNNFKNFKKFKKVWPIKMQVTIIPKSSMSVVKSNNSSHETTLNGDTANCNTEVSSTNVVTTNETSLQSSTTYTE